MKMKNKFLTVLKILTFTLIISDTTYGKDILLHIGPEYERWIEQYDEEE